MRTIKFRTWDKNAKKMRHFDRLWLCGEYQSLSLGLTEKDASEQEGDFCLDFDWEDLSEPMQFTGLKDKNGKEIYEGDILQSTPIKDVRFEVIFGWNKDGNAWGWCFKGDNATYSMDDAHERMEVISNIYENHDLLSKGDSHV